MKIANFLCTLVATSWLGAAGCGDSGSGNPLMPGGGGGAAGQGSGVNPNSDGGGGTGAGLGGPDAMPGDTTPQGIFNQVDRNQLNQRLLELTGGVQVTVNGQTYAITQRWSPDAKARFRAYWIQYFTALGIPAQELPFPVRNSDVGETNGHNLEAVLPGQSKDTVVIIVHYDSVASSGLEDKNPAADDDGSGLATQMEAARIFAAIPNRHYTVRFMAADYEEISNLAGSDAYVADLKQKAQTEGFKILVASDNDQTAWSCWSENKCSRGAPAKNSQFLLYYCCKGSQNHSELASGVTDVANHYSTLQVKAACDSEQDTDQYSFCNAGLPSYVLEEYDAGNNPYFDDHDDTMQHIDLDYLFHIAQIQITYQSILAGIGN